MERIDISKPEKTAIPEQIVLEKVISKYREQGLELENKFQPEIEKVTRKILDYLKEDSIESLHKKLKDRKRYPIGVIMSHFVLGDFSGEELKIGIDAGGESGYCVLSNPYPDLGLDPYPDDFDELLEQNKKEFGNIPSDVENVAVNFVPEDETIPPNVKDAIANFIPFEPDRKSVSGVVWTSGGIMNKFNKKSDTPHNGLWISQDQRGSGLAYGLYRLQESIFGVMKTEEAGKLSLLKTYLRLGFVPKSVLNPISGEKLTNIKVEEALQDCFTKQQETLDFHIYLERGTTDMEKV